MRSSAETYGRDPIIVYLSSLFFCDQFAYDLNVKIDFDMFLTQIADT